MRRLCRNGVDSSLADLFVFAAARPIPPGAEGKARARSAAEKLLWQRLETLPETRGQFRMNAQLPIPFAGCGSMEVDCLCSLRRLVIEVDGDQHLDPPESYRRDRRKDSLLQTSGYLVLRFLARDLSEHHPLILDTILHALHPKIHGAQRPCTRSMILGTRTHPPLEHAGFRKNTASRLFFHLVTR